MTLKHYCHIYNLLQEKQKLLQLLWIYDMHNLDLQIELLKNHYEIKDCEQRMRRILCD